MAASWYNRWVADVYTSKRWSLPGSSTGRRNYMDLRCPQCDSSDLKKVSLAYQEGLYHANTRTRLTGLLFGSAGPSALIGRARTKGSHQTELSRVLRPPLKWSYLKLVGWFGLILFISVIAYVQEVMASPPPVSSLPGELFAVVLCGVFVLLLAVIWKHNHSTYSTEYAKWNRSFVCQRCGAVNPQ
jgi:hypothetical protein